MPARKNISKQFLSCVVMAFGVVALSGVMTMTPIANYDIWWHLKAGELISAQRHIPVADPFSFTREGERWVTHEWLTELIFYRVWRVWGDNGLIAVKALLICAVLFVLYLAGRRRTGVKFIILAVVPLFLLLARHRFFVRPHLFSFLFFSLEYMILDCVSDGKISKKYLWFLPLLFVFWVNIHGGFVYGIVLFGMYTVCHAVSEYRRTFSFPPKSGMFAGVFLATLVACLANPNGIDVFTYGFTIYKEGYVATNNEWFSPFAPEMRAHTMVYVYVAYTFSVLIACIACYRYLNLTDVVTLLLFFSLSVKSQRNIPYFAMVSIPLLILFLDRFGRLLKKYLSGDCLILAGKWIVIALVWVGVIQIAHSGYPVALKDKGAVKPGLGINTAVLPVVAVSFLMRHGIYGNCFNSYHFGGYLLFRGYPDIRVFIDGRADVYGKHLYADYRKSLVIPSYFEQFEKQYSFDIAFLSLEESDAPLHRHLWNDPSWNLIYFDDMALIYVKSVGRFSRLIDRFAFRAVHPLLNDVYEESLRTNSAQIVDELNRALSLNHQTGSVYVRLARIYRNEKKFQEAESLLIAGLNNCPGNYLIINQLGLVYLNQKNFLQAQRYFSKAIRINKYQPQAYGNLALTYFEQGRLKQAKIFFKKVLRFNPEDTFALSAVKQIDNELSAR